MPSTVNGIVYHYCSLEAFKSIIENECLWLCDVEKSNDSAERIYFEKIMLKQIELYTNDLKRSDKANKNSALKILEFIQKAIQSPLTERAPVYSCSFSYNGDQLSQWRGYADDGYGVAIGFYKTNFQEITPKECFRDVNYSRNQAEEQCRKILEKAFDYFFREKHSNTNSSDLFFIFPILHHLVHDEVFFKSESFQEENECRLATADPANEYDESRSLYQTETHSFSLQTPAFIPDDNHPFILSNKKFRISNHRLSGYYELSFSKIKNDIIHSILLGPKCLAKPRDIQIFLQCHGYDTDPIEIIPFKATYR